MVRFILRILIAAALTALTAAAPAVHAQTGAETWPTRAVRILVGFPGGSTPDMAARALAEVLARSLGQPVVVENRPGAAGNIAADQVARATDDHTIGLMINGNLTIAKILNPATPYDPLKDLTPITILTATPMLLVTSRFWPKRVRGMKALLKQDGLTGWRVTARIWWYLLGSPGVLRKSFLPWLSYFLPGFHPWNHDDRALIAKHQGDFADALLPAIRDVLGEAVALDGQAMPGHEMLARLNGLFAQYGVGRGLYTGDTTIGLKGRIIFEAPGLAALLAGHRALEEAVLTKQQNRFKPEVARKWVELVYEGFYNDPLKADLEAFLQSSQACVNGEVVLETQGGRVDAVAVRSPHLLHAKGATYAQSADWGVAEAEGFIRLFGMSSTLWAEVNRR